MMKWQRPFRFGIAALQEYSHNGWVRLAREAEDLGYATFLWADHPNYPFSTAVALQAAADATTTLRVGSMVFNNDFRHPATLAKEAATLDVLTEGRFELGIGAGWKQSEYDQVGFSFDPPKVRLGRLEEAVHLIKRLFANDPVTFEGTYYTVRGLDGLPKPVQKPHPPLLIGGGGQGVLSLAAREADIVGIHYNLRGTATLESVAWDQYRSATLAQKVSWVRQVAGSRFNHVELTILIGSIAITDHLDLAIERFRQEGGWSQVTTEEILDSPYVLIGSREHCVEKLVRLREEYAISYITVPAVYCQLFAPIVASLTGKA